MKKLLVSFLPILLYNKYVLAAQRGIPLQVSILKIYFWVQIQRSHYTYCINATCVKYLVPIFLFKWHFFEILFYFFEIPTRGRSQTTWTGFGTIFTPPSPLWTDMNILMTPLKNYVNIWWPPSPFTQPINNTHRTY